MSDISKLKAVVKDSGELSSAGRLDDALNLINVVMADAEGRGEIMWLRTLSRHASAMCRSLGNLTMARHYIERLVQCDPSSAMARFALAEIMLRQGEAEQAKAQAAESYSLALGSTDEVDKGAIELIARLWPEMAAVRREGGQNGAGQSE
jgi:hypothetical protein